MNIKHAFFFFFIKKSHHGHGGMGTLGTALGAGLAGAAVTGHLSPVSFCVCYYQFFQHECLIPKTQVMLVSMRNSAAAGCFKD
jgi:hypothetical protein